MDPVDPLNRPRDPLGPGGLPPRTNPPLVERAKAMLLTPKTEWLAVDAEPATIGGIYRGYVLPLAAIGPVATLIGSLVFGYGAFGIHFRPSVTGAVTQAVVSYAVTLAGVYVLALIIEALAPNFGGQKDRLAAFKVAAYSATAGWLAGIFGIFPPLAILGLLGLYSLYLLYLGLPRLMRVPDDKAVVYTVVILVVGAVIWIVIGALAAAVARPIITPAMTIGATDTPATVTVPGVGTIDTGKLEAASKQMEAAAAQMQGAANGSGKAVVAVAPDRLAALLPAALPGGLARSDMSSESGGAGGIGGSAAKATYAAGDHSVRLTISDLGAMGALASLGNAFNVQSSKQDSDGYEKVGQVDGRMTTERWRTSGSGEYSTLVGSRFMVSAEGNPASVDALKGAVAAVDLQKLGGMAIN